MHEEFHCIIGAGHPHRASFPFRLDPGNQRLISLRLQQDPLLSGARDVLMSIWHERIRRVAGMGVNSYLLLCLHEDKRFKEILKGSLGISDQFFSILPSRFIFLRLPDELETH